MDKIICSGWHHTFGWLRRPELDLRNAGFCYETPDGEIVISKAARHRYGMYLNCHEDAATGERYTAISAAPRIYKVRSHAR